MNTDRERLVKEIFADALEKANAAERAAYLAEACGNDAQLRQHVEALLQAHENAGAFLEEPPAAALGVPPLGGEQTGPPKGGTPNRYRPTGKLGVSTTSSGVIFSTRAANRFFNSSVSPGTATNVPDDCSPARLAAACSTANGVSIR